MPAGAIPLLLKRTLALIFATTVAAQSGSGSSPVDNLPSNIAHLAFFGERPAWSPDASKLAFMAKGYGDAFEIDMKTRNMTLLTGYPHAGYLRAQYLPNGDLFLIGARSFETGEDITNLRYGRQETWVLKKGTMQPVALGEKISEGIAISRQANLIAWAITRQTNHELLPNRTSAIYVAEIAYPDGKPTLVNKREVLRKTAPECTLEAQDFRNNDTELTYVCYRLRPDLDYILGDVFGIDLRTGNITTYRQLYDEYNEVEGIYPSGKYTLLESSKDQTNPHGSRTLDIWRLRLEPNTTDFTRVTYFGNYTGYKASNPVVSRDGCLIAFQMGKGGEEAGVGHGIFFMNNTETELGCGWG